MFLSLSLLFLEIRKYDEFVVLTQKKIFSIFIENILGYLIFFDLFLIELFLSSLFS
jgi:hypothetical protein